MVDLGNAIRSGDRGKYFPKNSNFSAFENPSLRHKNTFLRTQNCGKLRKMIYYLCSLSLTNKQMDTGSY